MLVGDALNLIDTYYVDPVDREELLTSAMRGLTSGLDEHSEYIPLEDYETFQDSISQEFAGIGIYVEQPNEGEPVTVVTPLVGSPALRAGLLPGDQIMQVDDLDVSTMPLRDVSALLKGPVGTKVAVKVNRVSEPANVDDGDTVDDDGRGKELVKLLVELLVERDRIELQSIVGDYRDANDKWVYRLADDPTIAYIRMTSFGEKTTSELTAVLQQLDNDFSAIVLDLRGNGGGLLNTAVDVTDMFLDSGSIVSTRTRGGIIEDEFSATNGTLVDLSKPMAILIDGSSASASEIVSAALQDHDRAIVVGVRSYGKGTVQNILPLQFGRSALRLTVARYYRPSGVNIHRGKDAKEDDDWGVSPLENASIEIDIAVIQAIAERMRQATYPSLGSGGNNKSDSGSSKQQDEGPGTAQQTSDMVLDLNPAESGQDSEDVQTALSIDPQLRRAVNLLRQQLGMDVELDDKESPTEEETEEELTKAA